MGTSAILPPRRRLPGYALSVVGIFPIAPAETPVMLPLVGSHADCGFPSPADDYIERLLSLDDLVVRNPAATFLVRVAGDSMSGAGIASGDLLVVDRSVEARSGHIIVASVCGEHTVKYLRRARNGTIHLVPANKAYEPIRITAEMDFEVWGVVLFTLKKNT